jgi:hypothetical protein
MNWKIFRRKWFWTNFGVNPAFTWTDSGKSGKFSVEIPGIGANNPTDLLPNTISECYSS